MGKSTSLVKKVRCKTPAALLASKDEENLRKNVDACEMRHHIDAMKKTHISLYKQPVSWAGMVIVDLSISLE